MSTQENNATVALTFKNKSPAPPGNRLIEKQAEQFEEFGKQLQKSQEYENKLEKFDKEKYQKEIESQSELINELRARIEELENDSIEKDKNIKNLRDFSFFKNYEDMMEISNWISYSSYSPNDTTTPKPDLHSRIQNIVNLYGEGVRLKHLKFVKSSYYSIDELIEYTKTAKFNSLNKKSKRYLNFHIKNILLQEFHGQNVTLSQDLDEYIKRDILPRLPRGHDNYKNDINWLNTLNDSQKSRVRKLITRYCDEE